MHADASEVTVSAVTLNAPPSIWSVVKAQLYAVRKGLRKEALISFIVLIIYSAVIIGSLMMNATDGPRVLHADPTVMITWAIKQDLHGVSTVVPYHLLILPGLLIPLGVWRSEDPHRRSYHWAMPVSRELHTIIKTFVGWFWFLVGIAVWLAMGIVLRLISSSGALAPETFTLELVTLWLLSFLGPSIAYLLMAALVIASTHPWRWMMGVWGSYSILWMALKAAKKPELASDVSQVFFGSYGMFPALMGNRTLWPTALWVLIGIIAVCGAACWRSRYPPTNE